MVWAHLAVYTYVGFSPVLFGLSYNVQPSTFAVAVPSRHVGSPTPAPSHTESATVCSLRDSGGTKCMLRNDHATHQGVCFHEGSRWLECFLEQPPRNPFSKKACAFHCLGAVVGLFRPRQATMNVGSAKLLGQRERVISGLRSAAVILKSEGERRVGCPSQQRPVSTAQNLTPSLCSVPMA